MPVAVSHLGSIVPKVSKQYPERLAAVTTSALALNEFVEHATEPSARERARSASPTTPAQRTQTCAKLAR